MKFTTSQSISRAGPHPGKTAPLARQTSEAKTSVGQTMTVVPSNMPSPVCFTRIRDFSQGAVRYTAKTRWKKPPGCQTELSFFSFRLAVADMGPLCIWVRLLPNRESLNGGQPAGTLPLRRRDGIVTIRQLLPTSR